MNDSRRGLIPELIENKGHDEWDEEHWRKACQRGWDGGEDTYDKRQIKSIDFNRPPNHKRVFVGDHETAESFDVWEVDEPNMRARFRGSFKKEDVRTFWRDEETEKPARGVYVSDLR